MAWVNIDEFGSKYKHYPDEIFEMVIKATFDGKKSIYIDDLLFAEIVKKDFEICKFNRKIDETARLNNTGMYLEKKGEIDTAISVYEENVANGYPATHSYDRLMVIYRKLKDYKNERRIINKAIDIFTSENLRRAEGCKRLKPNMASEIDAAFLSNSRLYDYDGSIIYNPYPLGKWKKRLVQILKRDDDVKF